MPKRPGPERDPFAPKARAKVPFAFVLDELEPLGPTTRPMFGCLAVYIGAKIVLVLRDRRVGPEDDGVWVATVPEAGSLAEELPSLRPIALFGDKAAGWQVLPRDSETFEADVLTACALVRAGDPRIGKVPKARKRAPTAKSAAGKKKPPARR